MSAALPSTQTSENGDPARGSSGEVAKLKRDDFDRDVWSVLGLPVDMETIPSAVEKIETAARRGEGLAFVTPNVNMLCTAMADEKARADIVGHDLSLADGAPLVAIARLLGAPLAGRCAGADVFDALETRPAIPGVRLRVFFFGGRDGSAEKAVARLQRSVTGLEAAGFLNPGFGDVEEISSPAIIDQINAAKPDFVVVALGAKKGNDWIMRNARHLNAPVISHLGAVVDFKAGEIARSPQLVSKLGLEWAWRITQEPALWKRYWNDAKALVRIAATHIAPLITLRQRRTGKKADATIVFEPGSSRAVVKLSGDLVKDSLRPVRAAFREAVDTGKSIELDFADAGAMDGAFLGLVLMLEKAQLAMGKHYAISGLSEVQRRLLSLHNISYPTGLEDVPEKTGTGSAEEVIAPQRRTA